MKDLKKEIEIVTAKADTFPKEKNIIIEHNLREIPKMKGVTKNNWFGYPVRHNPNRQKDTTSIIYNF